MILSSVSAPRYNVINEQSMQILAEGLKHCAQLEELHIGYVPPAV